MCIRDSLAEVMAASEPRELRAGLVVVAHLARVGVLLECELALGLGVAGGVSTTVFGTACRLFLGPGFRLAARWNRLGEPVKTRKRR